MATRKNKDKNPSPQAQATEPVVEGAPVAPSEPDAEFQDYGEEPEKARKPARLIAIDYQGQAANMAGQAPVTHTYSPYVSTIVDPKNGAIEQLDIWCGCNVIDEDTYNRHVKAGGGLAAKIAAGYITKITKFPKDFDLTREGGLISRSRQKEGVEWIMKKAEDAKKAPPGARGRLPASRADPIIKACRAQLLKIAGMPKPLAA